MQCKICKGSAEKFCDKDFSHEHLPNKKKPAQKLFAYYICTQCHFCFCPEIMAWPPEKFAKDIYNKEYIKIDPPFSPGVTRAMLNAQELYKQQPHYSGKHLDYGGNKGELSAILAKKGWNSKTYDPFGRQSPISKGETFDLITSFEVFEHTTNPVEMLERLTKLLSNRGTILFSTNVHDGVLSKDWWYLNARAGHISLYSSFTLEVLACKFNLRYEMQSETSHIYHRV